MANRSFAACTHTDSSMHERPHTHVKCAAIPGSLGLYGPRGAPQAGSGRLRGALWASMGPGEPRRPAPAGSGRLRPAPGGSFGLYGPRGAPKAGSGRLRPAPGGSLGLYIISMGQDVVHPHKQDNSPSYFVSHAHNTFDSSPRSTRSVSLSSFHRIRAPRD